MTEEWRKWCRLCASYKQADHPIFDSNGIDGLTDKIKKYLSVTVDNTCDFPIAICADCVSRLLSFHHYAQRCLRVQAMFNALHFDNSYCRIEDIREKFLETEVNEMKNNQHPLLEDGTQIEKNYEMVPIVSDITVTSNSMKTQKKSVSYGKSRVKRRPKKSVQTIPRIRIRAIPTPQEQKSLESQEKNEDVLDNSNGSQDCNEYNSKVPDEIKKSTKRKAKIPLKHCKVMSPTIQIKDNENTNGEHNERLSERSCSDNDPVADVGKQKRKMKKSELKALLPSLYHFQCHICEYICKNWNSLRTHCKDLHQTVAQVTCVCGKLLMTRTAIIEHRSKHTDNTVYRCDKCEKTFHRKSLLNLHVMSHLPKEEQPFVCCKCARRFHCEALLRNHERVHLPKEERLVFPCHLCHKKFSSKSAVSAHLKAIHLGERPFVCDQCGHSFTSKGILQEHLTIHSDDAPWNCSKCNKNFKTKYRLKIHMDTHRETPYQCPKCPVQLSTRRTLRMHLVVHRDTKAYQCSTCGKAFRRAKDLKNHNNLHTGKRPYTCPFCARTFANGSNCRSHKRRMHPEELQLYEASLLLKNDTTRNNISPNTFQSEEDNNISLNIKEDDHNIINLSTASSLLSEERKTNFPLNFNPPIPSSSLLTFAAARNLSMMDVRRRDYSNTRHIVHQNLLSRNSFNQQLMAFPIDQHYYSSNHEQEHSPTSVPAFPGNPYIHHQQLIYNRASSNN